MTTKSRTPRKPIARSMTQNEKDACFALAFCYVMLFAAIAGAVFAAIQ